MKTFQPNLSILPEAQLRLWPELDAVPPFFTLYGGTALALRLGHRRSVDFDFFSNAPFDVDALASSLSFLDQAERVHVEPCTLTCRVQRGGPVLVSFYGGLSRGMAAPPERPEGRVFSVASLLDIAAAKMDVVQKRAEAKDYIDIAALLDNGLDLSAALGAACAIFGKQFNPLVTLKALSYFGDVPALPQEMGERLRRAVQAVTVEALPEGRLFKPRQAGKKVGKKE